MLNPLLAILADRYDANALQVLGDLGKNILSDPRQQAYFNSRQGALGELLALRSLFIDFGRLPDVDPLPERDPVGDPLEPDNRPSD